MTQNPHIIIVDDEAPAREMVGDYLKMHGFNVTLCDGGKSLRGAIESGVPDLVVATDDRRRTQFAQILGQVERKRIVIVEQQ